MPDICIAKFLPGSKAVFTFRFANKMVFVDLKLEAAYVNWQHILGADF